MKNIEIRIIPLNGVLSRNQLLYKDFLKTMAMNFIGTADKVSLVEFFVNHCIKSVGFCLGIGSYRVSNLFCSLTNSLEDIRMCITYDANFPEEFFSVEILISNINPAIDKEIATWFK